MKKRGDALEVYDPAKAVKLVDENAVYMKGVWRHKILNELERRSWQK